MNDVVLNKKDLEILKFAVRNDLEMSLDSSIMKNVEFPLADIKAFCTKVGLMDDLIEIIGK
jgi:hypothetical protein